LVSVSPAPSAEAFAAGFGAGAGVLVFRVSFLFRRMAISRKSAAVTIHRFRLMKSLGQPFCYPFNAERPSCQNNESSS
jgi:hypothetical protein